MIAQLGPSVAAAETIDRWLSPSPHKKHRAIDLLHAPLALRCRRRAAGSSDVPRPSRASRRLNHRQRPLTETLLPPSPVVAMALLRSRRCWDCDEGPRLLLLHPPLRHADRSRQTCLRRAKCQSQGPCINRWELHRRNGNRFQRDLLLRNRLRRRTMWLGNSGKWTCPAVQQWYYLVYDNIAHHRSLESVCAVIPTFGFQRPFLVIAAPSVSVSTTSNQTILVKASNLSQ